MFPIGTKNQRDKSAEKNRVFLQAGSQYPSSLLHSFYKKHVLLNKSACFCCFLMYVYMYMYDTYVCTQMYIYIYIYTFIMHAM